MPVLPDHWTTNQMRTVETKVSSVWVGLCSLRVASQSAVSSEWRDPHVTVGTSERPQVPEFPNIERTAGNIKQWKTVEGSGNGSQMDHSLFLIT